MTDREFDDFVGGLGRQLVNELAPEELPLFGAIHQECRKRRSVLARSWKAREDILGFGTSAEMLMTPFIVLALTEVGRFLLGISRETLQKFGTRQLSKALERSFEATKADTPLSSDQLGKIRAIVLETGGKLHIPNEKAELLADALLGKLSALTSCPPDDEDR